MKKPEVFLFPSAYVLLILSNFRQNFITLSHVQKMKKKGSRVVLRDARWKIEWNNFLFDMKKTHNLLSAICTIEAEVKGNFSCPWYTSIKFSNCIFFRKTALGAAPEKVNDLSCSILTDIGIYFAFYTCIALSIWCNAQDAANLLNLSPSGKLFMRENSIKKNNVKSPLNIIETLAKFFFSYDVRRFWHESED